MLNKRQIRELIIFGVLVAMYNVTVFVIPFTKNATFFSAYTFAMIAILGFAGCYIYAAYEKDTTLRNRFLSFPILKIGIWYVGIQLVYSTSSMIKATFWAMPAWIVIVPSLIMLAIAIIKVSIIDIARDKIKNIAYKQQEDTSFMRLLWVDIDSLSERLKDENAKIKLKQLAEKVKFSDPVSNKYLGEIEDQIKTKFAEMKASVLGGSSDIEGSVEEITLLLSERNKKCKMTKLDVNIYGENE